MHVYHGIICFIFLNFLTPTPTDFIFFHLFGFKLDRKVDWNKMANDSNTMADKLKKKLHLKSKSGFEKFQDFAAKNVYVAGGFTGGFFLGIASS